MAISAADPGAARRARRWWMLASLCLSACVRGGAPTLPSPAPDQATAASTDPTIRVVLASSAQGIGVGGGGALRVTGPDNAYLGDIDASDLRRIVPSGGGLAIETPRGRRTPAYTILTVQASDTTGPVRLEGRDYRGAVQFTRTRDGGAQAVNILSVETYVASVVSSELGRRAPNEREAVLAQAVVSRTYALKAQGRAIATGYDLTSGVGDQVYGGVANETDLGWDAVRATRGQVLTANGGLIDAQFFSTCGGRTANNDEAFRGDPRSYLRSIADVDGSGTAYCSISPRFRWRAEWTGPEVRVAMVRALTPLGVRPETLRQIRDVRVLGRTASDRVNGLSVGYGGSETVIDGSRVRDLVRTPSGEGLRSTAFDLSVTRSGGVVSHMVIDGRGAGHGVGMCQWGAVGRARAGQRYADILSAYFPGAKLERRY